MEWMIARINEEAEEGINSAGRERGAVGGSSRQGECMGPYSVRVRFAGCDRKERGTEKKKWPKGEKKEGKRERQAEEKAQAGGNDMPRVKVSAVKEKTCGGVWSDPKRTSPPSFLPSFIVLPFFQSISRPCLPLSSAS
mmetsp:Transcript_34060/g.67418  ORF Transcript_34060/g.67418 Transcript_34060/m.67418 type:complete len:138 (+) Transcript_34060:279-692(+)